jgi:hypothetical protein
MKLSLLLEIGRNRRCTAWCAEFPGAHVSHPSESEAVEVMPEEIASFLYFLRHFGEEICRTRSPKYSVVERQIFNVTLHPCDTQAFFSVDTEPLTLIEQKKFLRWLGHSRAMLLDLLNGLTAVAWEWKKEGKKGRALGKMGGGWTIEAYLKHIASAEKWYLSNFWSGLPKLKRADDVTERITLVRNQLKNCFARTTAEERKKIVNADGELWTLRKILRRALYHERCHSKGIARLLVQNDWNVADYIRKGLGA